MTKDIELELRAEVKKKDRLKLKRKLEKIGKLESHTKRLSVMFFGKIGKKKLDIRVRTTNGKSEVVIKTGSFGSHDRKEISQKISSEQFLGMVKIFHELGFFAEVGERETLNYLLPKGIIAAYVIAKSIAYVELEKMSSSADLTMNKKQIKQMAKLLELKLISSEAEFNELCERISRRVDWNFHGTKSEYEKIAVLLNKYKTEA